MAGGDGEGGEGILQQQAAIVGVHHPGRVEAGRFDASGGVGHRAGSDGQDDAKAHDW
jgi:hypothetical protein